MGLSDHGIAGNVAELVRDLRGAAAIGPQALEEGGALGGPVHRTLRRGPGFFAAAPIRCALESMAWGVRPSSDATSRIERFSRPYVWRRISRSAAVHFCLAFGAGGSSFGGMEIGRGLARARARSS